MMNDLFLNQLKLNGKSKKTSKQINYEPSGAYAPGAFYDFRKKVALKT